MLLILEMISVSWALKRILHLYTIDNCNESLNDATNLQKGREWTLINRF